MGREGAVAERLFTAQNGGCESVKERRRDTRAREKLATL